ncbi:Recombinase [uncultured Clostridium sp.]|nr:Recombinase [uncultured Clostridium sp.]
MNIGVYIETGGLNTMTVSDSIIDQYAALDQAESQSRSENIKFGIRHRMRSGKTLLNHTQFLGYTKGPDSVLQIVPEEAEVVRKIFELYIQGNGVRKIKKYLESHGIKTVTGKTEWSTSTIDRMLSNEKYIGQVLMQKSFTPDYLTGKKEKNSGQLAMYLVENAHEPIIDRETFDRVQERKGHIKHTVQMEWML